MMQPSNRRMFLTCARRTLLASAILAVGTMGVLGGCQSPVHSDAADASWHADAVLARAIADGSLATMPVNGPTDNQGVRELRNGATGADAAVVPAGNPAATLPTENAAVRAAATQAMSDEPATMGQQETVVRLSLEDALARAMGHSLAIKVEAYNPGIKEAQVTEALAAFDPVFFGQSQFTNQDQPAQLAASTNGVNWNNAIGVRQLLPSGGTAQIGAGETYRNFYSDTLVYPNPSNQANVNLALSQPLLRGFGSAITNANIYLAQRDQRIALTQFRRQVIQTVADVEEAYHNLVLARAAVDIQQRLLTNTQDTYNKIYARIDIDADRVAIKQAEAAVESRRAELIRAVASVRTASDRLKAAINDPELDLAGGAMIVPTDRPIDAPVAYNVAEQIDTALRQRTEMQEARLQIERADIIVDVAKNDLLPRLDVTLSTQSNGFDGVLGNAFTQTLNSPKMIDYAGGLKFEIPIGNRAAEATWRRRLLERKQALTQMLRIAQQVILDVKVQLRDVLTSYREIQARQAARLSAGEELSAITIQEQVQKLTPEFLRLKLDSQQRLANAELQELQSLVNYNLAMMRLEQAKGTLLEYNRISISRAPETDERNGKIRFMGQTYEVKKFK